MAHPFERIMVACDGSAQADSAFAHALEMAERFRADLLVLTVTRPPEPEVPVAAADPRAHYEEKFEKMRIEAASRGLVARFEVVPGHPAEEIVHRAEREGTGLIVMGRRGRTLFERWRLGSISERVLRYAPCPVMAVH